MIACSLGDCTINCIIFVLNLLNWENTGILTTVFLFSKGLTSSTQFPKTLGIWQFNWCFCVLNEQELWIRVEVETLTGKMKLKEADIKLSYIVTALLSWLH